jgi:hypothetical protein
MLIPSEQRERGIFPTGTSEDAGLKPLRLPQGKPALRKAPGPLTNKKRERALGYKIGPTLKNEGWGTRKTKSVGADSSGDLFETAKANELSPEAALGMTTFARGRKRPSVQKRRLRMTTKTPSAGGRFGIRGPDPPLKTKGGAPAKADSRKPCPGLTIFPQRKRCRAEARRYTDITQLTGW